jgi:hypothetical protein
MRAKVLANANLEKYGFEKIGKIGLKVLWKWSNSKR